MTLLIAAVLLAAVVVGQRPMELYRIHKIERKSQRFERMGGVRWQSRM